MDTIRVDEKTMEKAVASTVVSLHQAYIVTKRRTPREAKEEVLSFINNKILAGILEVDINKNYNDLKNLFAEAVDRMLKEYKSKPEKSYTGLLKLREMLE